MHKNKCFVYSSMSLYLHWSFCMTSIDNYIDTWLISYDVNSVCHSNNIHKYTLVLMVVWLYWCFSHPDNIYLIVLFCDDLLIDSSRKKIYYLYSKYRFYEAHLSMPIPTPSKSHSIYIYINIIWLAPSLLILLSLFQVRINIWLNWRKVINSLLCPECTSQSYFFILLLCSVLV